MKVFGKGNSDMIAEVTFNLISGQDKGVIYYFNTDIKNLKRGDESYGGLLWDKVKECDINDEV